MGLKIAPYSVDSVALVLAELYSYSSFHFIRGWLRPVCCPVHSFVHLSSSVAINPLLKLTYNAVCYLGLKQGRKIEQRLSAHLYFSHGFYKNSSVSHSTRQLQPPSLHDLHFRYFFVRSKRDSNTKTWHWADHVRGHFNSPWHVATPH
jgi:hypothetical protein